MEQKPHWTKVKVARVPLAQEALDAIRRHKKNEADIGKPDVTPEYEGDARLAELSWFKKGESSRKSPVRITDESGVEIKRPDEIDWSGFDNLKGLTAEIAFQAQIWEGFATALKSKP